MWSSSGILIVFCGAANTRSTMTVKACRYKTVYAQTYMQH
jgi:hypothetical protein